MAITINRTGGASFEKATELRGLSTDTKPTVALDENLDMPNGSIYFEIDTATAYMYSAEDDTWYEM